MDRPIARPALVAAALLLGVGVASVYNSYARAPEIRPARSSTLVGMVEAMEDDRLQLEDNLASLRERVGEMEERAAEEVGVQESFGAQLDQVRAVAGLTPVEGAGVIVSLADAESVPLGEDPSTCLIHDFDLVSVVNALFAAGAEAVSVNDERVVVTTAIRCAGSTVLVNSTRVGSPYEISAIGDPEDLEEALISDGTVGLLFDEYRVRYGLRTGIVERTDIEVPAFRGSLRTDAAGPVEEGTEG